MRTFRSRTQAETGKQLDRLLIEQSSALLEQMQSGGEQERRALAEWLSQSKRHVRAHLFMAALDQELQQIDPQRQIPIPDVRGMEDSSASALTPRSRAPSSAVEPGARAKNRWQWLAAAATVVFAVVLSAVYGPSADYLQGWRAFTTEVGEQRSVSLSDGSIVQLNTATRIMTRISPESRDIRLLNGEALFKVAKDPSRPFQVHTRLATIRAVGTQFNVHEVGGQIKVSVLEGRVRVAATDEPAAVAAAPIVAAGHEVEVGRDGKAIQRAAPDIGNTTAWLQRRVVFKQEPLINVVQEFNRYRKSPQLRVDDAKLATRKYSGTFDVDDPRSLRDVLSRDSDILLEESGEEIVIRARQDGAPGP